VTSRDRAFLRLLPLLVALLAAVLTGWALGVIDGTTAARAVIGWLALALLWQTAWRTPDVLNRTHPDETPPTTPGGVVIVLRLGIARYLSTSLRVGVTDPRLTEVIESVRETSVEDCPVGRGWRRVAPMLSLLAMVLAVVALAAEALAPSQVPLAALAVAVLGTSMLGIAALRALEELAHGLALRRWGSVVTGGGRVLLVAALLAAASWAGLLTDWADAWQRLL
jgi:hypothetical protein